MFGREVRNYLLDEDKIDIYRSYFGSRPETVFREETNEAAKEAARQSEEVLRQLNSINSCFVHGDMDQIAEILAGAEADTGLSNWNKLRIINECQTALFDLSLPFPGK